MHGCSMEKICYKDSEQAYWLYPLHSSVGGCYMFSDRVDK